MPIAIQPNYTPNWNALLKPDVALRQGRTTVRAESVQSQPPSPLTPTQAYAGHGALSTLPPDHPYTRYPYSSSHDYNLGEVGRTPAAPANIHAYSVPHEPIYPSIQGPVPATVTTTNAAVEAPATVSTRDITTHAPAYSPVYVAAPTTPAQSCCCAYCVSIPAPSVLSTPEAPKRVIKCEPGQPVIWTHDPYAVKVLPDDAEQDYYFAPPTDAVEYGYYGYRSPVADSPTSTSATEKSLPTTSTEEKLPELGTGHSESPTSVATINAMRPTASKNWCDMLDDDSEVDSTTDAVSAASQQPITVQKTTTLTPAKKALPTTPAAALAEEPVALRQHTSPKKPETSRTLPTAADTFMTRKVTGPKEIVDSLSVRGRLLCKTQAGLSKVVAFDEAKFSKGFSRGDLVVIPGDGHEDIVTVHNTLDFKGQKAMLVPVKRLATEKEAQQFTELLPVTRAQILKDARINARRLRLPCDILDVDVQIDLSKVTIHYLEHHEGSMKRGSDACELKDKEGENRQGNRFSLFIRKMYYSCHGARVWLNDLSNHKTLSHVVSMNIGEAQAYSSGQRDDSFPPDSREPVEKRSTASKVKPTLTPKGRDSDAKPKSGGSKRSTGARKVSGQ